MTLLHKLQIYIINDEISAETKSMTVKMNLYKWDDFRIVNTQEWPCNNLKPNSASLVTEFDIYKYLNDSSYDFHEYMAEFVLINEQNGEIITKNYAFPGDFKDVKAVGDSNPKLKIQTSKCDKGNHKISLEVKIQKPAIFMHISLNHQEIKKYRLSKNGFMQFEPAQIVQVMFKNPNCLETITVENFSFKTLNTFLI
jgi:Mannosidase Ig/CBM-like domain